MLDDQVSVLQRLAQELLHVGSSNPGRSQAGIDLGRPQLGRHHAAQRGNVALPAGIFA